MRKACYIPKKNTWICLRCLEKVPKHYPKIFSPTGGVTPWDKSTTINTIQVHETWSCLYWAFYDLPNKTQNLHFCRVTTVTTFTTHILRAEKTIMVSWFLGFEGISFYLIFQSTLNRTQGPTLLRIRPRTSMERDDRWWFLAGCWWYAWMVRKCSSESFTMLASDLYYRKLCVRLYNSTNVCLISV